MKLFQASLVCVGLLVVGLSYQTIQAQAPKAAAPAAPANAKQIERGRYIVEVGGCNDCHTAGYANAGGVAPEAERLKGDTLGYRGAWGTTYPTNLRMSIGLKTEEQWLKYGKTLMTRPPMPWFNVRALTDEDSRALYQYVKSLGVSGKAAPAFLAPDKAPPQPYIQWPGVK